MEFKFNVNKLLPNKINKITNTLVPEGFDGNRRELNECQRQLARILDDMGEASARAQGLNKSITSAHRLRDTDHIVYLLVDDRANNGHGVVVGLLKTGSKNLFMFDEAGVHYQLKPRCVLDFYVHESRQRMGLGNILYQYMLAEEGLKPTKLAIDRPSEKFLAFLRKYYGLSSIIPQNNKFVVFHGFFDDETTTTTVLHKPTPLVDNSVGDKLSNVDKDYTGANRISSANGIGCHGHATASGSSNSYGRYAAARPPCSMADIIHNTATLGQPVERMGDKTRNDNGNDNNYGNEAASTTTGLTKVERPRSLSLYTEAEQQRRTGGELSKVSASIVPEKRGPPSPSSQPQASFAGMPSEPEQRHEVNSAGSSVSCAQLVTPSGALQSSSSCAHQQVVTVSKHAGHIDLKFYHSPLW